MSTESLFLISGAPLWEFVERFGSYAAPAAPAAPAALAALLVIEGRRLSAPTMAVSRGP